MKPDKADAREVVDVTVLPTDDCAFSPLRLVLDQTSLPAFDQTLPLVYAHARTHARKPHHTRQQDAH